LGGQFQSLAASPLRLFLCPIRLSKAQTFGHKKSPTSWGFDIGCGELGIRTFHPI